MRSTAAPFRLWLLVAVAAALAIVLGVVGFLQFLPRRPEFEAATAADVAYYTLLLFVLDSTLFDVPRSYPLALDIARFLAPATSIFVVVETIRVLAWERARQWAAARSKGHIVITGNDPVASMLARQFAADGERVVLVGDDIGEEFARRHGLFVVSGDPTQERTLQAAGVRRAATVYACGQDSATNLAVVLLTRRMAVRPVSVQAELRDYELFADLRAARRADLGGADGDVRLWLNFFVVEDLAARALLAQESLVSGYHRTGSVVVLGDGLFGRAVVRQVGRRQDLRQASVTLVADAAAPFWTSSAEPSTVRLYVCLADPDLALRTALTQARRGLGRVVLCLREQWALQDALSGDGSGLFDDADGRLGVFGILDAACDAAPKDPVDELGRAIHDHYVEICVADGDTPATNASLVPWRKLPLHLKRSNWAQADHIGTKLAMIGCAIVPAVRGGEPFAFQDGEIEQLARLEHQRWMEERRAAGFVYGPVREGLCHPDLVGWADLPAGSRAKDVAFVEHLPEMLAGVGYQILRL